MDSDDGILVIDKNNNGTIDNGSELFGDQFILTDGTKYTDNSTSTIQNINLEVRLVA